MKRKVNLCLSIIMACVIGVAVSLFIFNNFCGSPVEAQEVRDEGAWATRFLPDEAIVLKSYKGYGPSPELDWVKFKLEGKTFLFGAGYKMAVLTQITEEEPPIKLQ